MALYKLRVESRSPSGVGMEWTECWGFTSRKEAQQEADLGNLHHASQIIDGVEHALYWFTERED